MCRSPQTLAERPEPCTDGRTGHGVTTTGTAGGGEALDTVPAVDAGRARLATAAAGGGDALDTVPAVDSDAGRARLATAAAVGSEAEGREAPALQSVVLAVEVEGEVVPLSDMTPEIWERLRSGISANEEAVAEEWGVGAATTGGSEPDPSIGSWLVWTGSGSEPASSLADAGFEAVPDDI